MSTKFEVENMFKEFYNIIECNFQTKINIVRSDNGTEYFNECLDIFSKERHFSSIYLSRHRPTKWNF